MNADAIMAQSVGEFPNALASNAVRQMFNLRRC